MRSFSVHKQIFVTLVLLAGCSKPPQNNQPDFDVDREVMEFLKTMKTCDTPEKDLPISEEAKQNAILIEDQIENMDYETVDCDGTVKDKGHGPVRMMQKNITIDAPVQLKEKVNFVAVKNARTCTSQKLQTLEAPEQEGDKPQEVNPLHGLSFAFNSGKTILSLIESDYKDYVWFNILEGNNVVELTYYGKCLKYANDAKGDLPDSIRCKDAEVLATKSVLIQVKVKRTEAKGVRKVDICSTKTSANK